MLSTTLTTTMSPPTTHSERPTTQPSKPRKIDLMMPSRLSSIHRSPSQRDHALHLNQLPTADSTSTWPWLTQHQVTPSQPPKMLLKNWDGLREPSLELKTPQALRHQLLPVSSTSRLIPLLLPQLSEPRSVTSLEDSDKTTRPSQRVTSHSSGRLSPPHKRPP